MKDISRYHEEQMTGEELRSFKKDMEADPFFREAVEGYEGHALLYINQHYKRLEEKYHPDTKGSNWRIVIPLAASVILIATFWFMISDRGVRTGPQVFTTNEIAEQNEQVERTTKQSTGFEESNEATLLQNEQLQAATGIEEMEEGGEDEEVMQRIRYKGQLEKTRRKSLGAPVYTGVVRNDQGEVVSGAIIHFRKNDATATTDFQGRFAVQLKQKEDTIVINHTTYESLVYGIGNNSKGINIELQRSEDIAVADAVELLGNDEQDMKIQSSAGQGTLLPEPKSEYRDETAPFEMSNMEDADPIPSFPKGGFNRFERYVTRNLKYPTIARVNNINGIVEVGFDIQQDGRLTNFKVMQSLGYGCDEEAIRIIREGPEWKTDPPGLATYTTYKIEFPQK
jgi:TonB family protein